MSKYICFEGSEGVGKTTQVTKMVEYLRKQGFSVLETKEPGTVHSPLTLELRKMMLDSKYEDPNNLNSLITHFYQTMMDRVFEPHMTDTAKSLLEESLTLIKQNKKMTLEARENISLAIRNIHLNKVIAPAMKKYDYIIQDRGILSGLSYGVAGGLKDEYMNPRNTQAVVESGLGKNYTDCYTQVIMLKGNVKKGLERALTAKQEFASGDVMEKRGVTFLEKVDSNFEHYSQEFSNVEKIVVDFKNIDEVFAEILNKIKR